MPEEHDPKNAKRSEIIDCKSTNSVTAFLQIDKCVYIIDHATMKGAHSNNLNNIVKIEAGCNHMIALKKVIREPLKDWTPG